VKVICTLSSILCLWLVPRPELGLDLINQAACRPPAGRLQAAVPERRLQFNIQEVLYHDSCERRLTAKEYSADGKATCCGQRMTLNLNSDQ
jgi:hypothetical protein